jgi:hypothetical protein
MKKAKVNNTAIFNIVLGFFGKINSCPMGRVYQFSISNF